MTTKDGALAVPVNLPDPGELATVWTQIFAHAAEALQATAGRYAQPSAPLPYDPHAPARAFAELSASWWSDPAWLLETQQAMVREWADLWANATVRTFAGSGDPLIAPAKGDRRFNDVAWNEPIFDYLKQAYLLTSRQTLDLVANSNLDPAQRTRADFFARQFLNMLSPANFAFTNPEAIRKALESGGISLLAGFANMLADAASPSGLVQRRAADNFELGVTIAAMPGAVIFRNTMMELIQYTPTTEEVYRRPLLYVPPLVNKFYVLDLQAHSSMICWLVEQGHSVFVISWVNPGPELRDKGIADYVQAGPVAALEVIEQVTGERIVDVFGFCMGGTLLAITAAYLNATGQGDRLGSLSMIGTLLDFTDMGEWATFYEPEQMDAFERHLDATGVIGADKLQALFSAVRANDLIWSSVVNHYLLDRVAPESDLLFWFGDGARIPQAFLLEYGRLLLRGNRLKEAGGMVVAGVPIDLGAIEAPTMMISLKDDHVSGWRATYDGARLLSGPTTFLLGGSGHNAGVINPPATRKHGYWTNEALPDTADQWLEGAQKQEGSWWPAWQAWLARGDDGKVLARIPGTAGLPVLEAAPGSYVRVK